MGWGKKERTFTHTKKGSSVEGKIGSKVSHLGVSSPPHRRAQANNCYSNTGISLDHFEKNIMSTSSRVVTVLVS